MPSAIEFIRQGQTEKLWQKCCGFLDLSLDECMAIQERLLLEQIELLDGCALGRQLLGGVQAGENYVLMATNLIGGPFVRYVIGDMIRITALRNEGLNIDIPQMTFVGRIDGLIDIAGFTRLTEKTIWQAIENSKLPYADWSVRKEEKGEKPVLHLYLELKKSSNTDARQVAAVIHEQLCRLDADYANLEKILGLKPLEVT